MTFWLDHCLPGGGEEGDGGHAQAERQGGVQGAGGLTFSQKLSIILWPFWQNYIYVVEIDSWLSHKYESKNRT